MEDAVEEEVAIEGEGEAERIEYEAVAVVADMVLMWDSLLSERESDLLNPWKIPEAIDIDLTPLLALQLVFVE